MDQSPKPDEPEPKEMEHYEYSDDYRRCNHCSEIRAVKIQPPPVDDIDSVFASKVFHDQCTNCQVHNSYPETACGFCKHLRLGHWFRCILPSLEPKVPLDCTIHEIEFEASASIFEQPGQNCGLCRLFQGASEGPVRKIAIRRWCECRASCFGTPHRTETHEKREFEISVAGRPGVKKRTIAVQATERASYMPYIHLREKVDWDTVRSWDIPSNTVSGLPVGFRIIDLDKKCLIEPLNPSHYATLSYVWGGSIADHEELQTTKSSLELLKEPGILSRLDLPTTIRDAMTACQELGFHYLWVDRLCIVQDDENNEYNKDDQINGMDSIYASSSITIVAASGASAHDGIAGISKHRGHHHAALIWEGLDLRPPFPDLDRILADTTWNGRGWTFQERICANNAIFFTDYGVFAVLYKDGLLGNSIHSEPTEKFTRKWERTKEYFAGVAEYTRRSLTLHTDILYAFKGAAKRLNCGPDIRYGLPMELFDDAILWQPAQWDRDVRPPDRSGKQTFPSWAWCSFHGPVKYEYPVMKKVFGVSASLASWAFPSPSGALEPVPFMPFMIDYPDIDHDRLFQADKELVKWHVTTMEYAWREGFFKKEYFTLERNHQYRGPFDLENDTMKCREPMGHFTSRLAIERGMRHSGNPDPVFLSSFSVEDRMMAYAKPGRILVFTQRASLELEYLGTVGFKRIFSLRSPKGSWMGLIRLAQSAADIHCSSIQTGSLLQMDFLALSITSDYDTIRSTAKELNMKMRKRDDGTWEPQTGEGEYKDSMPRKNTRNDNSRALDEEKTSLNVQSRKKFRSSFRTYTDTPARINVMLISQQDGVARRLGVGQVYMKRWKEAEPEFCTAVLE